MTTDLTKTTDSPSPLTPEDQRRIAVLRAVTDAIRSRQVFGAGPADATDVVHISNWVLGTFDPWAPQPAAEDEAPSAGEALAEEPQGRAWKIGDVVRLNVPSPTPSVAAIGQDGWVVAARGFTHRPAAPLLNSFGQLRLRHAAWRAGIDRWPSEITLVTPAIFAEGAQ